MGHGIYFGNTTIRNTIVRRNTVKNCVSSGIHVDHTMVASGNQVKDNVLFNNGVQLEHRTSPITMVPELHPVLRAELQYRVLRQCVLLPDQRNSCACGSCVNSPNWVDYGTFSNNRYFNPYNEVSIEQFNTDAGIRRYYTLEKWQDEMGQDAGSTRFPERRNAHATLSELTGNLVVNGTFDTNVDGWGGWPTMRPRRTTRTTWTMAACAPTCRTTRCMTPTRSAVLMISRSRTGAGTGCASACIPTTTVSCWPD